MKVKISICHKKTINNTMKDRILQIMNQEGMTSSNFAEEIGIQRAAMSHIFSGRNKPSLDVVKKILDRFTYINPDWLLNGKGDIRRDSNIPLNLPKQQDLFANPSYIPAEKKSRPEYRQENRDKKAEILPKKIENEQVRFNETPNKKVEKIMIFYSDKTYETFIAEKG